MKKRTSSDILKAVKEALHATGTEISAILAENARLKTENERLRRNAAGVVVGELRGEVKRLNDRLNLSYGEFSSEVELMHYREFAKKHEHDRAISRASSGKVPYVIAEGAGIGVVHKVVCPICGETKDITDITAW